VKKRYVVLFGTVLAFAVASCKSAPKTEEPAAAEPAPAEQTAAPAPAPVETAAPAPVDNSAALDKAAAARQAALDAGADKTTADLFSKTDDLYNTLKEKSAAGTDETAALADIAARYNALAEYAKALELKARIDNLGYAPYDQANYDKGSAAAAEFEPLAASDGATGSAMYDKAHLAYTSFDKALTTAFRKLAQDARTAAFKAKRDADIVYAGVSQKDTYTAGVKSFRDGDSSFSMQDPENALKHYGDARQTFETLFADISEKRAAAQKAIDDAKAKVSESADYAVQADKNAPLQGDNIKGIESPDAVLLQAETYEDPAGAQEDVPETITDSTDGSSAAATEAAK